MGFHLNLIFPEAFRIAKKVHRCHWRSGLGGLRRSGFGSADFPGHGAKHNVAWRRGDHRIGRAAHAMQAGKIDYCQRTLEQAGSWPHSLMQRTLLADVTERLPDADI